MNGGVFRNKKKKEEKNVVKNINIKYSPSVWSYSPMNRLVKKRTVRAEKKNASVYLFVCFPTGVITDRKNNTTKKFSKFN